MTKSIKRSIVLASIGWLLAGPALVHHVRAEEASKPIAWREDLRVAIESARREKQPLLVFVTATWCGYCGKMERETWANTDVIQAVRKQFVPVRVDADENRVLLQRLGVMAMPTCLVIDPQGTVVSRSEGFMRPEATIKFVRKATATQRQ